MRHIRVIDEIRADLDTAPDDLHEAALGQGSQDGVDRVEHLAQDGVQFEDHDAIVRDQLVQGVQHGDRGDVAGAEDD